MEARSLQNPAVPAPISASPHPNPAEPTPEPTSSSPKSDGMNGFWAGRCSSGSAAPLFHSCAGGWNGAETARCLNQVGSWRLCPAGAAPPRHLRGYGSCDDNSSKPAAAPDRRPAATSAALGSCTHLQPVCRQRAGSILGAVPALCLGALGLQGRQGCERRGCVVVTGTRVAH